MAKDKFLNLVAKDIVSRHADMGKLCIVLPSRRSISFFSHYLGNQIGKHTWAPGLSAINDLMGKLSGMTAADELSLVFMIYEEYQKATGSKESIDQFYSWGEIMLKDFDEVDKYMVDAGQLFTNIKELKELDNLNEHLNEEQLKLIKRFWEGFEKRKMPGTREEFLKTWRKLPEIYQKTRKRLLDEGLAYEGMMYRYVAENAKNDPSITVGYEKYIFVGFNALTKSEESLFKTLRDSNKAEFYWDYDPYYMGNNSQQEAGLFLRNYTNSFKAPESFDPESDFVNKQAPEVSIFEMPDNISQVKLLNQLLNEDRDMLPGNGEFDKTAIIPADESLLLPLLRSMPPDCGPLNITMGYPIHLSPSYSLLELLINLHRTARQPGGKTSFYHKYAISLLNHPYVGTIDSEYKDKIQEIRDYNMIFIEQAFFENTSHAYLFKYPETALAFGDYLLYSLSKLIEAMYSGEEEKQQATKLNIEFAYQAHKAITRVQDILRQQKLEPGFKLYYELIKQALRSQRISFEGEPLSGLQLMGMLETRTLDFDHLLMLSVNEGTVPPSTGTGNSFIPYNLRRAFGLPVKETNDAIYAYYFYRILQGTQKLALIYQTSKDGGQKGEKSRFLQQLKYESGLKIKYFQLGGSYASMDKEPQARPKDEYCLNVLSAYTSTDGDQVKALSPSAINTWIDCKLRFYFRYIARLEEAEDVHEDIDASMFGQIFHGAAERIYGPWKDKTIGKADISAILKNNTLIDECISKSFFKSFYHNEDKKRPIEGEHAIIFNVVKKYLKKLLEIDMKTAPFRVLGLENSVKCELEVTMPDGKELIINLYGLADRIDEKDGTIRLIDYKTGKGYNKIKSPTLDALFDSKNEKRSRHILQALTYSLIYKKQYTPDERIRPSLFYSGDFFSDDYSDHIKIEKQDLLSFEPVEKAFTMLLQTTLAEIFDPHIDFTPTEIEKNCEYCPYAGICR